MDSSRAFQILAVINGGMGFLIAAMVLPGVIGASRVVRQDGMMWVFPIAMLLAACLISGFLIRASWLHLKRPDQKSALMLTSNTTVILWLSIRGSLHTVRINEWTGIGISIGSILIAYLAHRFFLKPSALRAFPSVES